MKKLTSIRNFQLNPITQNLCVSFKRRHINFPFHNVKIKPRPLSTAEVLPSDEKLSSKPVKKNFHILTIPLLTEEYLSEVSEITGLSVGTFYVSWIKFLISSTPTILEWNAKLLPDNFRTKSSEPNILKYAYYIKESLPRSDIYVTETFSIKGNRLSEKLNDIHLTSMLTVLLNGFPKDPYYRDKVFFQKKKIVDTLYNLLSGRSRISTTSVAEGIVNEIKLNDEPDGDEILDGTYTQYGLPLIRISPKCLDIYNFSTKEKKEDLSTAFLIGLAFVNVYILKNEATLEKLCRRN